MREFKNILFATDFSESSEYAFSYALTLAKKYNARLFLLHVINEPVDLRGFYAPHISFDKLEEEIQEAAQLMMEKFCQARLRDYDNYETAIVPGIAYEELLKKAADEAVDLIVMGTHGRTGLDHMLFGSTAEKVVRKSPVPVMTVRLPA